MAARVYTHRYESSHGRTPRGRGLWIFWLEWLCSPTRAFQFTGSYGEAKKAVLAEARKEGAISIHVMP
jgi:hypothetical protein